MLHFSCIGYTQLFSIAADSYAVFDYIVCNVFESPMNILTRYSDEVEDL